MIPQEALDGESVDRLRQILVDQLAAVEDILRRSQDLLDSHGDHEVFVDQIEELMAYRAGQVIQVEDLEGQRRELLGSQGQLDASLGPIHQQIQDSLALLASMDARLRNLIFDAQLQIINNMAFTPEFVNFGASATEDYRGGNRVVNVTR